jgi:hypothetical protein
MNIKTKYDIGNTIFLIEKNKVMETSIIGIKTRSGKTLAQDAKAISKITYFLDSKLVGGELTREEFEIFLTKEELLDSL